MYFDMQNRDFDEQTGILFKRNRGFGGKGGMGNNLNILK